MVRRFAWLVIAGAVTGCLLKPDRPSGAGDGGLGDGGAGDARNDGGSAAYPNIMFVSSGVFLYPWAPTSNADMFCSNAAHMRGLLGSYVGWLSSPALSIGDRLLSLPLAHSWRRPDGMPFADTVADITTGNLLSPPRIDEYGRDAVNADPTIQVATGTMSNGKYVPGDDAACGAGNIEIGTPANAPAGSWTEAGHVPCSTNSLHLYCFSIDGH